MKTLLVLTALLSLATASMADDWLVRRALLPEEVEASGLPAWEVELDEQDDGDVEFSVTEPTDANCQGAIIVVQRMVLPGGVRRDRPALLPRIELNYTSECDDPDSSGYVGAIVLTQDEWERYTPGDETEAHWMEPEDGILEAVHKPHDPDVTEPATWTGPHYPSRIRHLYNEPIYVGIVLRGDHEDVERWSGVLQIRMSEVRIPRWTSSGRDPVSRVLATAFAVAAPDDIIMREYTSG